MWVSSHKEISMGATSVTGTGLGAAVGNQKGSEHTTIGAEKLIGPRVVAADSVTLDGGGDAVIVLPSLDGDISNYILTVTDADAAAAAAVAGTLAGDSTSTTVTLKGPASGVVNYSIIKKGLAV